ncbi:hypothetical protein SORBI_3003G331550 [Sorghum bicolor]|uniref:Uncharacterized protein n=1 Tax=Sorghum bicolor TaxID=4558 RepID=A0A1W0W037_SORBI|nr:hypothetical protein SORBI_3003G331550 [Sorghum bicolor]OQU87734.1 hypothetical protein SORBI_3003G331550 [Sorghum bicolor]
MQKQGKKKNNNKAHDNFFGIDWTIIRDSERDHDVDGSIVSCPDITIHDNELTNNQSYNRAEKRLSGQFLVLALEMDGWIEMLSSHLCHQTLPTCLANSLPQEEHSISIVFNI